MRTVLFKIFILYFKSYFMSVYSYYFIVNLAHTRDLKHIFHLFEQIFTDWELDVVRRQKFNFFLQKRVLKFNAINDLETRVKNPSNYSFITIGFCETNIFTILLPKK